MKTISVFVLAVLVAVQGYAGEIHDAAAAGNLDRVRALAAASPASVNSRDRGTTPLHEAARGGHLAVVRFLIEHGANPNTNDVHGATALRLALGYRRDDVAAYLRQHGAMEKLVAPVAATPPAAGVQQPAPAATVTQLPTPPTRQPAVVQKQPPAQLPRPAVIAEPAPAAAAKATNAIARSATNALPSAKEMLPVIYPIHEAARIGDVEQIKYLLKSFPDLIESTDQKGMTPLHTAVASKKIAAAQALVGLHAKVNAKSDAGQTPLHLAARANDAALCSLLLSNRADVNARDNLEATPLVAATLPGDKEEFQAADLSRGTARFSVEQRRAAAAQMHQQQYAVVKLLVERGADVNSRTRNGASPLMQAVRVRNEAVVDLLLQRGADPNAVDSLGGVTPLHIAAGRGMSNIVLSLVKAKAAVNAPDARGETPLGYALHDAHRGVATLLQQRGGTIGAHRPLSTLEQNLVEFYQRTETALQRGSASDKSKIILDMTPTKSDVEKMFPTHAEAAWRVVDQVRRQIKQAFQKPVVDADQGKEIWRVRPEPVSFVAQDWQSRGWLNRQLPAFSLVVDRLGTTSRPGDYCFVNNHWVLLPPLDMIAAAQQAKR